MKRTLGLLAVLCLSAAVSAQQATPKKQYKVAGVWTGVTKMPDKNATQQWTIMQTGQKVTGSMKDESGMEYPFVGTFDDVGFFRVDIKVGDQVEKVRATLDKDSLNTMDGSILIGAHEYVWGAKLNK